METNTAILPEGAAKPAIFISYSRKDLAFADRLDAALKARGFAPLIDRSEIYAFEDWWERLKSLIVRADTIVFVLSPDAVVSREALKEFEFAASLNKRFAPIIFRAVADSALPDALRRLNFIFFDDDARFETSADALSDALQTDIGWIRQHTDYGEAERNWSLAGRPSGLLLRPPTLDIAEHWIASRPRGAPEPTESIRTYIAESRRGVRLAQRRWRLVQSSIYVLLLSIIGGLLGWINQAYLIEQWRWYTRERPFVSANIWPYVLQKPAEQALKPKDTFRECAAARGQDLCPAMVVVPAGSFMMGTKATTFDDLSSDEVPQHAVTIGQAFAVSKTEISFDEWDICVEYGGCEADISAAQGNRGQQPVIDVTWENAQQYVAWLSKITGRQYRLLSEAEYEYAARGGTGTTYYWGENVQLGGTAMANCNGCGSKWDNKTTAPVGSFVPNAFGLYDMVGNVHQWVEDCDHPNYFGAPANGSAWTEGSDCKSRVVRGGSWVNSTGSVRPAARNSGARDFRSPNLGFRVARTLMP
jgi:formylglycine-generating enzyme required for sulfatase activity